jgi:hypothetical protein
MLLEGSPFVARYRGRGVKEKEEAEGKVVREGGGGAREGEPHDVMWEGVIDQ